MHKPLLTREQIAFFIYRFRKFDVTKREQRQRLIDSFVNAVYLYEDKIILTFNYKDDSKTITLEEVEGSDLTVLGAPTEAGSFFKLFYRKAAPLCSVTVVMTGFSEKIAYSAFPKIRKSYKKIFVQVRFLDTGFSQACVFFCP